MTSAYFADFVTQPTVITEPGTYRTRCGEIVQIHTASTRHDYGCKGTYANGVPDSWHKSGRLYPIQDTQNDIIGPVL